jgi:hypothetical protein
MAPDSGITTEQTVFGPKLTGDRIHNPENPGCSVKMATGIDDDEFTIVLRSLAQREDQRQMQVQFNRMISDTASQVEPLNATCRVSGHFNKEADIYVTLAPIDMRFRKLWAMVLVQDGGRMTLTCKESRELTTEQATLSDLLPALAWEPDNMKTPNGPDNGYT